MELLGPVCDSLSLLARDRRLLDIDFVELFCYSLELLVTFL